MQFYATRNDWAMPENIEGQLDGKLVPMRDVTCDQCGKVVYKLWISPLDTEL